MWANRRSDVRRRALLLLDARTGNDCEIPTGAGAVKNEHGRATGPTEDDGQTTIRT